MPMALALPLDGLLTFGVGGDSWIGIASSVVMADCLLEWGEVSLRARAVVEEMLDAGEDRRVLWTE